MISDISRPKRAGRMARLLVCYTPHGSRIRIDVHYTILKDIITSVRVAVVIDSQSSIPQYNNNNNKPQLCHQSCLNNYAGWTP